jgi:SAM-dependent methyltransferase
MEKRGRLFFLYRGTALPLEKPALLGAKHWVKGAKRSLRRPLLSFLDRPAFTCPICLYTGKFLDKKRTHGTRRNAVCPRCGSLERQRLQVCVLDEIFSNYSGSGKAALHIAPEAVIRAILSKRFSRYTSADLDPRRADVQADLRDLPFPTGSYDFVFASHVLEHIDDDMRSLAEIARVLGPGGIAVLAVPILSARTIEYPYPVPTESHHVRAPGIDYFERYGSVFSHVTIKSSADFPEAFQLYSYEDRSRYPTKACPFRVAVLGERHLGYVSICWKA